MQQIHNDGIFKNEEKKRFEWTVEGHLALIDYIENAQKEIFLTHTEVPQALEGKGYGSRLVKAVLDYVRNENLTLYPTCPFVAAYIKRHTEYQDLVKKGLKY